MPKSNSPVARLVWIPALAAVLLASCATTESPSSSAKSLVPGDASAPSQVAPSEALAIARQLASHAWQPFAANILHGSDRAGVLVHSADAGHTDPSGRRGFWLPGEVNTGIPYKWGGFDDPTSFNAAVARGLAAGDISSPEKRRLGNAAVSAQAAGLDCSGFVSRCLKLPSVHDTTQLPAVCTVLPGPQDLRPGDILNIPRRHVLLFAGWVNAERSWIYFYETGGQPDYWRPGLKQAPLAAIMALGYQALRYRGMAYEPKTDGKEVLTRSALQSAASVPNPTIGEP